MRKSLQANYKLTLLFRFLFTFLVVLLFSYNTYSQSFLKGVVSDAADDVPLPAATVLIKGTTTGAITDANGEYILRLSPGTHTIEFSYLGFNPEEREITIEEDEIIELNVGLSLSAFTGEEIVITAQARGQLAAVNQQVKSDKIVNVVAAEKIKEFPDDNAAQSISRLPGVHLDGSQVVIRGIQPKLNKILINGVEMPSTEDNTRAVSLDMISSNMLSGIEVFKTVTPDMDADAIGGVVNLRLQEAAEGLKYSFLAQGNYNSQEQLGSSKFWGSVSNRVLNNKVGLSLNVNYTSSNGGNDDLRTEYESETEADDSPWLFAKVQVTDNINKSESYGGSFMADYVLKNGKIIFNSILTNKSKEDISYSDQADLEDHSSRNFGFTHKSNSTLIVNNSLQFDYQLGRVKLDAAVSNISFKKHTDYDYEYRFYVVSGAYAGDDINNNEFRKTMEPWNLYEYEVEGLAETARFRDFYLDPGGDNFSENRLTTSFNVEVPFTVSSFMDIKLKAGGKYRNMYRENDKTRLTYGDQITPESVQVAFQDWLTEQGVENWKAALLFKNFMKTDYETNSNFMNNSNYYSLPYVFDNNLMDEMVLNQMDYSLLATHPDSYYEDYWGGEELFAGYIMASINLWNKLLIIPGVRYESLTNDYSAYKVGAVAKLQEKIMDTLNIDLTNEHLLPHLHTRLNVTNWFDIRFSYNQTLSRPDYSYIVPKVQYNTADKSVTVGSPYLEPALSTNYDLNFSFHTKRLGLITIGGYKKKIDKMFFEQQTLVKNIPDSAIRNELPTETFPSLLETQTNYYINNPHEADLSGVELEWQSNLTWLPRPFNGLVLNANYSRIWSETKYVKDKIDRVEEFLDEPPYYRLTLVENDTFFVGSIQNQANHIGNISVGYDYKGFSVRLSFRYQGEIIKSVKFRDAENEYKDPYYRYDLALKQNIPLKFARMELYFNAVNLTNVPSRTYNIYPNKGKTYTRQTFSGQQFQFGIRLRNKI